MTEDRCVICSTLIQELDGGLCDAHKYDERLQAVREGWVLVPREPTEAMIKACVDVWQSRLRHKAALGRLLSSSNPRESFRQNYAAMIAAAPKSVEDSEDAA